MELTQIAPFGLQILEPVTSLTDLITASVCYFAYFQLSKEQRVEPEHRFFRVYFLLLGITTTFAGLIGHAFLYLVNDYWKMIGWTCSGLGFFFAERSALYFNRNTLSKSFFQTGLVINGIKLIAFYSFLLWIAYTGFKAETGFKVVQLNSTVGLIGFVLPLHLWRSLKTNAQGSRKLCWAIAAGIFPAITYNTQFTLHTWFNYHDISHVLMAGVVFLQYLAARQLATEEPNLSIIRDIPTTS